MLTILLFLQGTCLSILAFTVWMSGEFSIPLYDKTFIFGPDGRLLTAMAGFAILFVSYMVFAKVMVSRTRSTATAKAHRQEENQWPR